MLEKLKAKRAEIATLREERGATDPILIIAGIAITLILLVGGTFAISGFMNNAHDMNVKADLDRVAYAQAAYMATHDSWATISNGTSVEQKLAEADIALRITDGVKVQHIANVNGWITAIGSESGKVFLRTSKSTTTYENTVPSSALFPGVHAGRVNSMVNAVRAQ